MKVSSQKIDFSQLEELFSTRAKEVFVDEASAKRIGHAIKNRLEATFSLGRPTVGMFLHQLESIPVLQEIGLQNHNVVTAIVMSVLGNAFCAIGENGSEPLVKAILLIRPRIEAMARRLQYNDILARAGPRGSEMPE